jgi:hypothetical protein
MPNGRFCFWKVWFVSPFLLQINIEKLEGVDGHTITISHPLDYIRTAPTRPEP